LAIIVPVFVTIALGCVDFGRFAYNYIAISNAVRAGAAWAMMNPPASMASPAAAWQTSIQTAVSNEMSLQPGFQSGSLSVNTVTPTSNGDTPTTYRFTVAASYPFQTIVTWNISMFGSNLGVPNSLTLSNSVSMRFIRP
jgi:Flp pilus assembly protein TadG